MQGERHEPVAGGGLQGRARPSGESNGEGACVRAGPLTLGLGYHRVTVDGPEVRLTPIEFKLLRVLAERPGWVFSGDLLVQLVWDQEPWGDNRMVPVHVSRLRRKLQVDPRILS